MSVFHFPLSILHLLGLAAVSLICGLLVWPQLSAAWPSIDEKIDQFRRQPPLAKLVLLLFVGAFVVFGGGKTNGVDQASGTNGIVRLFGLFDCSIEETRPTVTPEDIARGWQLWEVRTNNGICYAMPEGATMASNWWVRGAFEDCSIVRLGDCSIGGCVSQSNNLNNPNNHTLSFPFGMNEYDSAWAFSWGKLRFELGNTNTEIVAVGAPMSAVPYRSRLWSAANTNDSRFVTWENFVLGRQPLTANSQPLTALSAQIELRSTGDFITRSNEVEMVYRRVDPEDWDGDGWRNDDDPNPCCWEEFYDYFEQELPEGANEAAYCWIEIRTRWHSYIEFVGDGPSNLGDPYLWAKAGETYRVQLLIGKTYAVVSSQPVDVVGRSSSSIEIDGNGTSEIEVVWPVTFSALEGNGSSFMMLVAPSGLGGTFTWTQHCCGLTGYGNQFWWAHERYCYCAGCYACGWYLYEGYALWCEGGHCCCPCYDDDDPYEPQEDDGPYAAGASVEFSESAVIFEDAYTNMPGEVVARQSTQTTLTCIAHGGETGGTATFSIENGNKLIACSGGSLPVTRFVPPLQKVEFEIVYEGKLPSGSARDIRAKADFTERGTGTRHSTQRDWLTSVKVELETDKTAPENPDRHRHVYGIAEDIHYRSYPASANVTWTFPRTFIGRGSGWVMCPWSLQGLSGSMTAQVGGVDYEFDYTVVEPVIEARNPRVNVEPEYVSPVIGEAGHLLLYLDLYATPFYVSFEGVQMREVPDESQSCPHQGYYDDQGKGGNWSHTANDGAGSWYTVNSSGYVMSDKAGRRTSYQTPWTSGWKEWDIPMEWGEGGVVQVPFDPNPTTQRFELRSDGFFTIRKHGHYAERNVFGLKWCDGELVW